MDMSEFKSVLGDDIDVDELLNGSFLADETFGLKLDVSAHHQQQNESSMKEFLKEEEQTSLGSPMSYEDDEPAAYQRLDRAIGQKSKREAYSPAKIKLENSGSNDPDLQPPRLAQSADLALLHVPNASENRFMRVVEQPPLEVRTRTKNENRTFSCVVRVDSLPSSDCASASVELCYATDTSTIVKTMGGTLDKPILNGQVKFDDLSVSVASPKHGEREFVLKITLNAGNSQANPNDLVVFSSPFYAYSHKSVLKRRREISLRATSHASISCQGGEPMHVVGAPFVRSDRLQCVFRVRKADCDPNTREAIERASPTNEDEEWFSIRADSMDFFSESVLFFHTPSVLKHTSRDIRAYLQVTNDGRNFSNALPITFVVDGPPSPKRVCEIRSRM